jgi:hypothetical protein
MDPLDVTSASKCPEKSETLPPTCPDLLGNFEAALAIFQTDKAEVSTLNVKVAADLEKDGSKVAAWEVALLNACVNKKILGRNDSIFNPWRDIWLCLQ